MSQRCTQLLLLLLTSAASADNGRAWPRHVIDDGSRGADGVRLADINGDGRPDTVTGWEEGGEIRVCLHPGAAKVKEKWPAVTVGKVASPEDAVFADVDGDGNIDVISSCEGRTRGVFIHFAPARDKLLDPAAWTTARLPPSEGKQWMFCLPMQIDGKQGIDLVVGGKNAGAQIGWFESPADPRRLNDWKWHPLRDAGWIMSLVAEDMDGDGDQDILFSDRRGKRSGVYWLENPSWKEHTIGAAGGEAMFLSTGDIDGDGLRDVIVATRPKELLWLRRTKEGWENHPIPLPDDTGGAKGVAIGDINRDGNPDLVFTCESAKDKFGVMWMSRDGDRWTPHDIGGKVGDKFDQPQLLDLDGDGDLDVITTEERQLNAVIWYENPTR